MTILSKPDSTSSPALLEKTAYERWSEMPEGSFARDVFYANNARAIEATRPKPSPLSAPALLDKPSKDSAPGLLEKPTAFQRYTALTDRPFAQAAYYRANTGAVEASRPR